MDLTEDFESTDSHAQFVLYAYGWDGIYNQILYVFALQWYSAIFPTATETPAFTRAGQAPGINHHHSPCLPNKVPSRTFYSRVILI